MNWPSDSLSQLVSGVCWSPLRTAHNGCFSNPDDGLMGSRPLEEAGHVKETADGLHLRGLHSVADDISLCLFGRLPRAIGTKSLCGRPDPLGPAQPAPVFPVPAFIFHPLQGWKACGGWCRLLKATSAGLSARLCVGKRCPSLLWGASRALSARWKKNKGWV